MDFFQSHKLCEAVAILPSSIFPNVQVALVKRLAGSPKGWNWSKPYANSVTQGSTRILIYIDGLLSVAQTVPKPLLSYLLPFQFNCTSKTTGGSKGLKLIRPYANKVLLKVAHAFLYTLMDFFQSHKLCPRLLSYLLPFSRTFNCTSKTTGWLQRAEIDPNLPTLTKCYSR
jgi:hypothetical protein